VAQQLVSLFEVSKTNFSSWDILSRASHNPLLVPSFLQSWNKLSRQIAKEVFWTARFTNRTLKMTTPVPLMNPDTEALPAELEARLDKVAEFITQHLPSQQVRSTQGAETKLRAFLQELSLLELVNAIPVIRDVIKDRTRNIANLHTQQPQLQQQQQALTWVRDPSPNIH
jgi:NAD-specific glutamate dehydrogenase